MFAASLVAVTLATTPMTARHDPSQTVWTTREAPNFTESTPIGNGRIGAMVFGGVKNEHIVLNESTMWSGSEQDADKPQAYKVLPEIRQLLLQGQNRKAQELLQREFVCKGPGSGFGGSKDGPYGCYQVFSFLNIESPLASFTDYERSLDLEKAVAMTTFVSDAVHYTRESFVSAPARAFVYHVSADKKGQVSFKAVLSRPENAMVKIEGSDIVIEGQLKSGNPSKEGVRFYGRLVIQQKGGRLTASGDSLILTDADEATVLFTCGTDMFNKDFVQRADRDMAKVSASSYQKLKSDHVRDYQKFYHRVTLSLPEGTSASAPTVQRLIASQKGEDDPSLAALYFNFGRYLLISSSRPDSPLPSNLQGIWAEELLTPWNGDFHIDINVQMNYWPAEVCNLSDCHKPLLNFIPKLVRNGSKTAQAYYGAKGWVAHVITNPWLFTSPGEGADWGSTCSGGGWLCEHLWRHYEYTLDKRYLASIYPTLRGAAQFFLDMLIEEPKNKWLVTAPSNSPENAYVHPTDGALTTCMGPTIDNQIVRELFNNTISAAKVLGKDKSLVEQLETKVQRLAPTRIGKHGQIMEWLEDYDETDIHHRHASMLYGLYPGEEISTAVSPDLVVAAKTTLQRRGDMGTGWSLAWKVCFWARLDDGDHAWLLLKRLLKPVGGMGVEMSNGGGTYPNLFDAHPPFQIDGNFGATAGIAEMLVRSEPGGVRLLPALPSAWASKGSVRGLKAKGGLTVDIDWEMAKVTSYKVTGRNAKSVRVFLPGSSVKPVR